jgi:hypothetical protein
MEIITVSKAIIIKVIIVIMPKITITNVVITRSNAIIIKVVIVTALKVIIIVYVV